MDFRLRLRLCVVLLLGFALRTLPIVQESLWRDEVDVIRFAYAPLSELFGNFLRAGMNGPLYLIFMRGWLALGGVNDFSLRYFSVLCGVLGIALVFALGRLMQGSNRFKRSDPFVFAALLMALSPVMVWYSGEGKMYALLVAITLFALVCILRGWWMAFALAVTCGFYIHILFVLFVPVAVVFSLNALIAKRSDTSSRTARSSPTAKQAFAFITLPYLPILAWQLQAWLNGFVTGHTFYPLDQVLINLFYAWSAGVATRFPFGLDWRFGIFGAFGFVVLALWALQSSARAWKKWAWAALLVWLLLPALLITLISTRAPVFEPRYLLWCAPALYVLLGLGYRRCVAVIAIAISLMGLLGQWITPIRPDTRSAAAYIRQNAAPGDLALFQMPYAKYTFEHYWGSPFLPEMDGPFTNDGSSPDEFLRSQMPSAKRIWLVESEPEMWDARHLTREWLAQNATELKHFSALGVEVWLFAIEK